jgi:hypothetical protein
MSRFEFKPGTFLWFYAVAFVLCRESHFLVSWCVGDRCDMADSDEDYGRSRRPGAEDQGWSNTGRVLSGRAIERSGDTVCGLPHA